MVGTPSQGDRRPYAVQAEAEGRRYDEQGEGEKEELRDGEAQQARDAEAEAEHSGAAAGDEEAGAETAGAGQEGEQEKKSVVLCRVCCRSRALRYALCYALCYALRYSLCYASTAGVWTNRSHDKFHFGGRQAEGLAAQAVAVVAQAQAWG